MKTQMTRLLHLISGRALTGELYIYIYIYIYIYMLSIEDIVERLVDTIDCLNFHSFTTKSQAQ